MKKLMILAMALLLLCACGKQEEPAAPVAPPMQEEVAEAPATDEVPKEPVEIPTEIVEPEEPKEPSPAEVPEESFPLDWGMTCVEGLIEDTVAYQLDQPYFENMDCADKISEFYAALVTQLENHTKENVYPAVMEQHTGANVYGIMDAISWNDQWVEVEYTYRVEYLNGAKEEKFSRIDRFDLQTGEIIYAE